MFKVGIITVNGEERSKSVDEMIQQLKPFEVTVFVDEHRQGQPYNFTRMLHYFCHMEKSTPYILLCTDDVLFEEDYLDKLKEVVTNTEYDVYSLFTNRKLTSTNEYGYDGTYKHSLYDVAVLYDSRLLTPDYYERFMQYTQEPCRTAREKKHYDIMHSHFIRDMGIPLLVIQPKLVKHKNLKSTLGHNCKVG